MIIIHVYVKVAPKHRDTLLEQVKDVVAPSQAEAGNISYQFYEHLEQPNDFVFLEKWKDRESIRYHEETTHFKNFSERVKPILLTPIHVELPETLDGE